MRDNSGHLLPLALLLQLFAVAPCLIAQTGQMGTLGGTIKGASGQVVANATVTVIGEGIGQIRNTTTGTTGSYKFENLSAGTYKVRFEAPGWKTVEIPEVRVKGTETTVLDQTLEATGIQDQAKTGEEESAERAFQQFEGAVAAGSGLSPGTDSGEPQRTGIARQTSAHAEDPSADGVNYDHSHGGGAVLLGAGGHNSSAGRDLHLALGAYRETYISSPPTLPFGRPSHWEPTRGPIRFTRLWRGFTARA